MGSLSGMSKFDARLAEGKIGESIIAQWLKSRGNHVLPVYEVEKGQYAGPAIYAADGRSFVAPDMLSFGSKSVTWIEAKHKDAFTWHRKTRRFTTGIDLHHYRQYLEVMRLTEWPVWLMFLHRSGAAKDSPPGPTGLFGNDLAYLAEHENHRSDRWGRSGMVYWAVDHLKKLAPWP